jgi:hypothetical protein
MQRSNSENQFITEIRTQFERDLSVKDTLDRKSVNMITLSSSVSTALIAIITFALTEKLIINNYSSSVIVSIAFAIGISAIGLFIWSYRLRDYQYPLGHEIFFENGIYKKQIVKKWRTSTKEEFNDRIVEEYLSSIKTNAKSNKSKAIVLEYGQWLFLCSITMVSLWLMISYILTI